ncbi:hypothetical protein KC19_6G149800 [Ceratodon purpureus]|uniref:Uncharacterized protein n=1 Tax=Ceratodon purpureus TaxID=3225 RepID=A0A8T0HES7_CERPU|nr:hypothetical protein KC19_6G149800 [Ceratodon purpureus]
MGTPSLRQGLGFRRCSVCRILCLTPVFHTWHIHLSCRSKIGSILLPGGAAACRLCILTFHTVNTFTNHRGTQELNTYYSKKLAANQRTDRAGYS